MALEPIHQFTFSLAHILDLADLTRNAVYQVAAFTVYSDFGGVASICEGACDGARFVD